MLPLLYPAHATDAPLLLGQRMMLLPLLLLLLLLLLSLLLPMLPLLPLLL
jgi:hypothetical protein